MEPTNTSPALEENNELTKLKTKLEEAEKQKAEYLAGWQRARADFLNYKKEEMERIKTLMGYVSEEMVLKTLPLLDNLYLAEKNLPEDLRENEYVKGLLQIIVQFEDLLKNQEIEPIEVLGKKFDPQFHEIIGETEIEGKEAGTIVEETRKGYLSKGELLRPTRVKITK